MTFLKRAAVGAAVLAGILTAAGQSAAADGFDTIVEKAKAEGNVIVRITNPSSPEAHAALEKAFNERFGLSVKLEWTPQGAPQTNARVIAEAGANQGSVDIIGLGSAEDVEALRSRGLVKEFPWVEVFGKELPGIERVVNDVIPDLRGATFNLLDAIYGVGWNTNMIKAEEVPSTTAELSDPKWNGKLALNAFFLNPLPTIAYVIGQDQMLDYARKLVENKPILQRGSPVVMQALSVGQAPLGIITYHAAQAAKKKGQPVDFKLFSDYIMIYQGLIYIPENAPHPNAARLFMAWLATEGTKVASEFEAMPRISDEGSAAANFVKEAQAKSGAKIATPTSLKEIAAQEALRASLTKLLTSAGN
ncbi:ABC transporter substrate-binding protein [Aminobacter sp. HY435]|uniref:ABC transporter substrate-binding protein n=1 Tax=Aminobacter sp. HY435 TaxID=2970917 RepID=UPI0022B974A4|nr:ABC transporter substrate-binding protein [Aminobacter sp. HY435]